jgi:hypothetical protein
VVRRVAAAAGAGRVGSRIRAALESAVAQAEASGAVRRRGDFLWRFDATEPALRDRGEMSASLRGMAMVAPEELELAIVKVVADAFGMDAPGIAPAVVRLLGLLRLTDETREVVDAAIDRVVASGRLQRRGQQLTVEA